MHEVSRFSLFRSISSEIRTLARSKLSVARQKLRFVAKERFGDQNRLIDHDAASFYEFDSKKQEALYERVMSSQNDEPVLFSCGVCYGIKKKNVNFTSNTSKCSVT